MLGGLPSFEADLRRWMVRVYERRARLVRRSLEQQVMRILDAERRWLVPLTAGVVLGVAALPVIGPLGIWGTLALLYVGAFLSGVATMRRAERVERTVAPSADPARAAAVAWAARPPMGVDEQNRLVRIMNLARSAAYPSVRPVLLGEVGEALAEEPLASWSFMRDLDDLLRTDAAALA